MPVTPDRRALQPGAHEPPRIALISVVWAAIAVGLRSWRIGHGLPDLNEEAFPFRHAISLWGVDGSGPDLDPHWFAYPSLTIYLQYLVQQIWYHIAGFGSPSDFLLALATDPTPAVVSGRMIGVLADAGTVILAGRICRRFGRGPAFVAAGLLALSPAMIRTSRLIYADSVMTALVMAALERLLAYRDSGGRKRMVQAAVLCGLAMGAKYPAAMLLIPLLFGVWRVEAPVPALKSSLVALAIAGAAFGCTTPYLFASWPEFARDLLHMSDTTTRGSLGIVSGPALSYAAGRLAENLGWVGTACLLVSPLPGGPEKARSDARFLWLAFAALFVPVAAVPVIAERYVLPSLAVATCLVAAGAAGITSRPELQRRFTSIGVLTLVLLQPAWLGLATASRGQTTTQAQAKDWCRSHLRDSDVVLSEAYGPNLLTYDQRAQVMSSPTFQGASASAQRAYSQQRAYHMIWMPLLVGGYALVRPPIAGAPELSVYPHAVDWNAAAYDVRLLRGIDYVITTDAVRTRFAADTVRFHEQARFYGLLERTARIAASFAPRGEVEGPRITIYGLTLTSRDAITQAGRLDALWWARTVPARFRHLADSLMATAVDSAGVVAGIPPWAQALKAAYAARYGSFSIDLAQHLASVRETAAAEDILVSSLAIAPDDVDAAFLYAIVTKGSDDCRTVARVLGRSIDAIARSAAVPPEIVQAHEEAVIRCEPTPPGAPTAAGGRGRGP